MLGVPLTKWEKQFPFGHDESQQQRHVLTCKDFASVTVGDWVQNMCPNTDCLFAKLKNHGRHRENPNWCSCILWQFMRYMIEQAPKNTPLRLGYVYLWEHILDRRMYCASLVQPPTTATGETQVVHAEVHLERAGIHSNAIVVSDNDRLVVAIIDANAKRAEAVATSVDWEAVFRRSDGQPWNTVIVQPVPTHALFAPIMWLYAAMNSSHGVAAIDIVQTFVQSTETQQCDGAPTFEVFLLDRFTPSIDDIDRVLRAHAWERDVNLQLAIWSDAVYQ